MTLALDDAFLGPFEVRLGAARNHRDVPSHAVYVRRRLVVGLLFVALCALVAVTGYSVLADRGSVPASTPAIQPASSPSADPLAAAPLAAPSGPSAPSASVAATYIVQPGDTLWSIAEHWRGDASVTDYVDRLVSANGGASVDAGQLLMLP